MSATKRKIINWLRENKLVLRAGKADEYHPAARMITYSRRHKEEKQIYSILHECGHYLIQEEDDYEIKYKTQIEGYKDGRKKRSLRWRIDYLKEEMLAWDVGKQLAEELGITINEKEYDKHAAFCLKSYCHWVIEPSSYED